MTKKNHNVKAQDTAFKSTTLQWLNPQTNAEDVRWLDANHDGYVQLIFDFLEDVQEDERVSVKRDPQSTRWLAILFCGGGDARNSGVALSVRGATPADALILLAYFHWVRFEAEYPATAGDDLGRWG